MRDNIFFLHSGSRYIYIRVCEQLLIAKKAEARTVGGQKTTQCHSWAHCGRPCHWKSSNSNLYKRYQKFSRWIPFRRDFFEFWITLWENLPNRTGTRTILSTEIFVKSWLFFEGYLVESLCIPSLFISICLFFFYFLAFFILMLLF